MQSSGSAGLGIGWKVDFSQATSSSRESMPESNAGGRCDGLRRNIGRRAIAHSHSTCQLLGSPLRNGQAIVAWRIEGIKTHVSCLRRLHVRGACVEQYPPSFPFSDVSTLNCLAHVIVPSRMLLSAPITICILSCILLPAAA